MSLKPNIVLEIDDDEDLASVVADLDQLLIENQRLVERNDKCQRHVLARIFQDNAGYAECTKALEFMDFVYKPEDVQEATRYLQREGLVIIEERTEGTFLGLTHEGVKAVVNMYKKPSNIPMMYVRNVANL